MDVKVIYLTPQSAWRNELRSDTLWGLICWGVCYIWGESKLLNMISEFQNGSPPFLVSSAFPYREEEGHKVLYLPKPYFRPFKLSDEEWTPERMKAYKAFKKVTYVPLSIFTQMIQGKLSEEEYFLKHESSWKRHKEILPQKRTYVHNSVDRLGGETDIYNVSLWGSAPLNGLYFFLRILNPEYENILRSLWPFFEHVGLGGDSSIGRGFFRISEEEEAEAFPVPDKAKRFVTLSLYSPTPDEIKVFSQSKDETWYQLEIRKGRVGGKLYVTSHILKQSVTMFREGSSFPAMDKSHYGCLQLVKNVETVPHKVYQYSYAFPVTFT
ncbi:MAG: type III-A CRISPR-associated RAMP protein Csm4 [Calditrichia bacterium]